MSIGELRDLAVTPFSLSSSRHEIMDRLEGLVAQLGILRIEATLLVDGRFLTAEINPPDVDFAVLVQEQFYETCTSEQREILDWVRDVQQIKSTHLCHCYLCVEFTSEHPDWFVGVQNRNWWENLYSESDDSPPHGMAEIEVPLVAL